MIAVTYREEGATCRLTVTGHADYQPGNDIVCAAVSGLVYALMGYLSNATPPACGCVMSAQSGAFEACCTIGRDCDDCAPCAAFDVALIGLLQLERQYPGHVKVDQKKFLK